MEDLVPNEETVVMMTRDGYIKRLEPDTFKVQARGGKGVMGLTTKEEDTVEFMFTSQTHNDVLFFTTKGRAFQLKVYEIPQASRVAKGTPVVNFLQLIGGENFSSWKWTLKDAVINSKEVVVKQAVTINIGSFIQNIFDFIIIALAIFLMVKILNRLKKNIIKDEEAGKSVPAPLTKDQELLVEIRDALKK